MKTFHIKTWGCQMNYCDSENIREKLMNVGMKEVDSFEEADVAILNTCSVRQKAEDKVSGIGRRLIEIKKTNPTFQIILTGCMSQRIDRKSNVEDLGYKEHLKRQFDWVDHFLPIGDVNTIPGLLGIKKNINNSKPKKNSDSIGYVPISIGCNNFCSYCVVPFSRGQESSIDIELIREKVKSLRSNGAKIIILLGQNVNSWQKKINGKDSKFPDLLDVIAKENSEIWMSFLTSHPKDFDENLIRVMKDNSNVCKYLNLPVQSGSDKVLSRMNRKYTRSDYLNKIEQLREVLPEVRLSTDIIVGFSGESDKNFKDTLDLMEEVGFSMAYISEYSLRGGTAGSLLNDDVSVEKKKERKKILNDVIIKKAREYNEKFIGTVLEVVVVKDGTGKTFDLTDVRLDSRDVGTKVRVKIESASECGLTGSIIV